MSPYCALFRLYPDAQVIFHKMKNGHSAVEAQSLAPIAFVDFAAIEDGMAVDKGALYAPVEGMPLQRTPAALALDKVLLQCPGCVGTYQYEVGLPAFADEAAFADAIELGRGVAHLFDHLLYCEDAFVD